MQDPEQKELEKQLPAWAVKLANLLGNNKNANNTPRV
jgi:hypothetical protein